MYDVQIRDVPRRAMVSERQHHVRQADLPQANIGALGRVAEAAQRYGGPAAPLFTIFHDEEYDENDINFETCAPIADTAEPSGDPAIRVEPAHREAYVRLTSKQAMPPEIGAAYGAVSEWIRSNGHAVAFGPREIYLRDFATAADDDIMLEVAFPLR